MKQKGFAILFALLVTTSVLTLVSGIFALAEKERVLSRAGRDSQLAFFMADAGADCAFFWDRKFFLATNPSTGAPFTASVFRSSSASTLPPAGVVRCNQNPGPPASVVSSGDLVSNGGSVTSIQGWRVGSPAVPDPTLTSAVTEFILPGTTTAVFTANYRGPCAVVRVSKLVLDPTPPALIQTTVRSEGLSICDQTNPRTARRVITSTY